MATRLRLLGLCSGIIAYNLLVREMGPYSGMVMPLYVLSIVYLLASIPRRWGSVALAALLLCNGGLFLAKKAVIGAQWNQRSSSAFRTALRGTLPEPGIVLGASQYYYVSKQLGHEFYSIEPILNSWHDFPPETVRQLLRKVDLVIIAPNTNLEWIQQLQSYGFSTQEKARETTQKRTRVFFAGTDSHEAVFFSLFPGYE